VRGWAGSPSSSIGCSTPTAPGCENSGSVSRAPATRAGYLVQVAIIELLFCAASIVPEASVIEQFN
jgi:hypothetical protein